MDAAQRPAYRMTPAVAAHASSERVRDRGEVLAGKAAAHAAAGAPEMAAGVSTEALDLAEQTFSARNLGPLQAVDQRLARWSAFPAVRDFHDR